MFWGCLACHCHNGGEVCERQEVKPAIFFSVASGSGWNLGKSPAGQFVVSCDRFQHEVHRKPAVYKNPRWRVWLLASVSVNITCLCWTLRWQTAHGGSCLPKSPLGSWQFGSLLSLKCLISPKSSTITRLWGKPSWPSSRPSSLIPGCSCILRGKWEGSQNSEPISVTVCFPVQKSYRQIRYPELKHVFKECVCVVWCVSVCVFAHTHACTHTPVFMWRSGDNSVKPFLSLPFSTDSSLNWSH